jgi:hypothetical protein
MSEFSKALVRILDSFQQLYQVYRSVPVPGTVRSTDRSLQARGGTVPVSLRRVWMNFFVSPRVPASLWSVVGGETGEIEESLAGGQERKRKRDGKLEVPVLLLPTR